MRCDDEEEEECSFGCGDFAEDPLDLCGIT